MDGLRCCTPHTRRPQEQISKQKTHRHRIPCSPNLATFPAFRIPHFLPRAGNSVWLKTSRKKENRTTL
jgi:hypothetical protein